MDKTILLSRLRFFVNGADPQKISVEASKRIWTLPLGNVRELLEFLGQSSDSRYALIDGNEPLLDEKPLKHLVANLRLYGWEPIVISRGIFAVSLEDPTELLENLHNVGLTWFHLEFDGRLLEAIGLSAIQSMYDAVKKASLLVTGCYYLTKEPSSIRWLYRLWDDIAFNQVSSYFYIYPRVPSLDQLPENDIIEKSFLTTELIVGSRGTLVLYNAENGRQQRCSLFDKTWPGTLAEWLYPRDFLEKG